MKAEIQEAVKSAMRNKQAPRLAALRLITAEIKQFEVDKRTIAGNNDILVILEKLLKQRKDSIEKFQQANRQDLVEKESFEVCVIQEFLPEPLSQSEIENHITTAFEQTGAETMKEMGQVMAILKPLLQGRADLSAVSKLVKEKLS